MRGNRRVWRWALGLAAVASLGSVQAQATQKFGPLELSGNL